MQFRRKVLEFLKHDALCLLFFSSARRGNLLGLNNAVKIASMSSPGPGFWSQILTQPCHNSQKNVSIVAIRLQFAMCVCVCVENSWRCVGNFHGQSASHALGEVTTHANKFCISFTLLLGFFLSFVFTIFISHSRSRLSACCQNAINLPYAHPPLGMCRQHDGKHKETERHVHK